MEKILIKWGGSVLTDKSKVNALRPEILSQLCQDLAAYLDLFPESKIHLGHGAGSFGHPQAKDWMKASTIEKDDKKRAVLSAVRALSSQVTKALIDAELFPKTLHPSDFKSVEIWSEQMQKNEQEQLLLFHGDIIGNTLYSTEELSLNLKEKFDRVIFLTDQDGVMGPDGLLSSVTSEQLSQFPAFKVTNTDVTGAMKHKVASLIQLAGTSKVSIINGKIKGRFLDELLNRNQVKSQLTQ